MGKSTLARYVAERLRERVHAHTILIFDPKRTFKSIPHTNDLDELDEMITDPKFIEVAYQPLGINTESESIEVSEEFDNFFSVIGVEHHLGFGERASRKNLGPIILFVDEAWLIKSNDNLSRLVRLADSKNFYLIQAAHRPTDFGNATRSQLDEVFLFRQGLADDLEIVEEWAGEEIAERVRTLPPFHVVRYEITTERFEVWDSPKDWYLKNDANDEPSRIEGEAQAIAGD